MGLNRFRTIDLVSLSPIRIVIGLILFASATLQADRQDWPVYRGSAAATQYSTLDQINRSNVHKLEVAWTYQTGDAGNRTMIQCNPLMIDGVLYGTSPKLDVFAVNAATGTEIWRHKPSSSNSIEGVNRGVTYWTDGRETRILFTAGHELVCLNAATGQVLPEFGESGRVDLRKHLKYPPESLSLSVTSPGIVYKDLIIMGSSTGEGYQAS
ncbi:MAG: pyrroloquinoline quinone-dependent dehydrogenase, partial [Verrucomicrobiae bacterium]|nr:pyrroloquinoline quinone-dependent dehydrogenase [Verrucomicrobiae bacterium]